MDAGEHQVPFLRGAASLRESDRVGGGHRRGVRDAPSLRLGDRGTYAPEVRVHGRRVVTVRLEQQPVVRDGRHRLLEHGKPGGRLALHVDEVYDGRPQKGRRKRERERTHVPIEAIEVAWKVKQRRWTSYKREGQKGNQAIAIYKPGIQYRCQCQGG